MTKLTMIELNKELSAIHQVMNISCTWAGNKKAAWNLTKRETEICRAILAKEEELLANRVAAIYA